MTKTAKIPSVETYSDVNLPAFGYELIRSLLLPDLLGEEEESVLYWAGRKIARNYPLHTIEEIIHFFVKAGWGNLELKDQGKSQMAFHLSSDIVTARIKRDTDCPFTLEAGFLAEQIQQQIGLATEAYSETKSGKQKSVNLIVKWDNKDILENTLY